MEEEFDRIKVLDSPPGSGKTSYAIQMINSMDSDIKVIYITPYLDEVERIINSCPNKNFVQPETKKGRGSKAKHLVKLVANGENIVSTHALFTKITDELINVLRVNNYILILDEVFQTVERFDLNESGMSTLAKEAITKQDVETLIKKDIISVEEDFRVLWTDENLPLSKYENLMELCKRELIYFINGGLLLWTFPIEVFREGIFSEIYILTYRFESQLQAYYYKYFELEYVKYMVKMNKKNRYEIFKGDSKDNEQDWKKCVRDKIHILEDTKLNKCGDPYKDNRNILHETILSKSWYERNSSSVVVIKNNLSNYFVHITKSKAQDRLWTCYKDDLRYFKNKNISTKSWLACNARATNDYMEKTVLAYLINRYLDPFYDDFFEKKEIKIDQDEYALSEMLQWIWRSAIRNNQDIWIYIPSSRMRNLLKDYLLK